MSKRVHYVGMDVHKETIAVACQVRFGVKGINSARLD
jgi:hypothetical protein